VPSAPVFIQAAVSKSAIAKQMQVVERIGGRVWQEGECAGWQGEGAGLLTSDLIGQAIAQGTDSFHLSAGQVHLPDRHHWAWVLQNAMSKAPAVSSLRCGPHRPGPFSLRFLGIPMLFQCHQENGS